MTLPAQTRHGAHCSGCRDAGAADCGGCTTFRICGSAPAVADAVVRLEDLGWRLHTSPEQESPQVWRLQVTTPDRT